ncbi:MAG: dTDP-4-dehydrorhamnose 3,5-epimerase [Nevskia sp.]|nr:dTDP-4-dehydrorhamnose 3,5-epimerase [Nevskia sp.]
MKFADTPLPGVVVIEPEPIVDERGFFARLFCAREFAAHGLVPHLEQYSVSFSARAGTLRGMHYQAEPHAEAKLVRCTSGAIYDVALDLRSDSPSFKRWFAVELSAGNRRALYLPQGCAHGFQTLCDDVEVSYGISAPYVPAAARGVRWDDPAFGIEWPAAACRTMAERDRTYPDFRG